MALTRIAKFLLVVHISVSKLNTLKFVLKIEMFQLASCYLKVDNIEIAANEKYNKVEVTLDNSDPEKTAINYHSQLTSDKPLQRAKVPLNSVKFLCDIY